MAQVPLEDVFTMLDRARVSGETISGFTHEDIWQSYKALIQTIIHEFNRKLSGFTVGPYASFFQELILKRVASGTPQDQEADPFTIVTLNWDTIPDYLLNTLGTNYKAVLDYGCYDYDLNSASDHIPSIRRKGAGLFNIKLLKLHGSLNWLLCSCCGRLFSVNQSGTTPPIAPLQSKCSFCHGDVELENVIITPTLIKNLAQHQIKHIWHNAFLDLQDSSRIVFVGYSFPMADFEFRYTLLKAITGNSLLKIRVILYPPDPCTGEKLWARNEIEERYSRFFGNLRDVDFKYMDSSDFMLDPQLIWDW